MHRPSDNWGLRGLFEAFRYGRAGFRGLFVDEDWLGFEDRARWIRNTRRRRHVIDGLLHERKSKKSFPVFHVKFQKLIYLRLYIVYLRKDRSWSVINLDAPRHTYLSFYFDYSRS